MKAGFARKRITPPAGTKMLGFGGRDNQHGCAGTHDDLFVRALFLEHQGQQALIMGFDLCFFGREEADRYRGALGRKLDLAPRQILLNTSHTHAGPATALWSYRDYESPDRLYLAELESSLLRAAAAARSNMQDVSLWAGKTRTRLPLSRRKPDGKGGVEWRPYPLGTICDGLPVCLLKDQAGQAIVMLYSVSCHPSTISGWQISADYPGVASNLLDAQLGLPDGGSLFLQGCGGDTKACVIGDGRDESDVCWRSGSPEDVEAAGRIVAEEIKPLLATGLSQVEPALCCQAIEMEWPLAPLPSHAELAAWATAPSNDTLRQLWARRQLELLNRGTPLRTSAAITLHGIQLGTGLRIIGIEGEAVADLGLLIEGFYGSGITFPLGYSNGAQLYLPSGHMLAEGGYEVESYYEYGFPSRLAAGMEKVLLDGLARLRTLGVQ